MAAATRARSCCLLMGAEPLLGSVVECGMSIETISVVVVVVVECGMLKETVSVVLSGSCTVTVELQPSHTGFEALIGFNEMSQPNQVQAINI